MHTSKATGPGIARMEAAHAPPCVCVRAVSRPASMTADPFPHADACRVCRPWQDNVAWHCTAAFESPELNERHHAKACLPHVAQ